MDQDAVQQLKEDFLEWSGGFPPESNDQITVYVDYARTLDLLEEDTREVLRQWMLSEDIAR
jgi:hypothetical protein